MAKQRGSVSKKVLLVAVVVILAAGAGAYLHFHKRNPHNLVNSSGSKKVTGATSQPTPHQTPSSTGTAISGQSGGVTDNNGQTSQSLPPSSEWVSSNSGNVTLQLPSPDSTVKSGDSLTGLAKVSNVQFILTDNSVGMIAQGSLKVVNGKFSGTLQFTPHSGNGKLEVYYPNPNNGAEQDIVEINVKFSTS